MNIYFDRIKPLFSASGKTDKDLETEIGLPRSIIYKWENNLNKAYKNYCDKIAAYFNVSTDYLLGNSDEKNKPETDEGLRLSKDEIEMVRRYRSLNPEIQAAIDRLTGAK